MKSPGLPALADPGVLPNKMDGLAARMEGLEQAVDVLTGVLGKARMPARVGP